MERYHRILSEIWRLDLVVDVNGYYE